MTWAEAVCDIFVSLLVVIGVLGCFTNTLEVLFRGWPAVKVKKKTLKEKDGGEYDEI